MFDIMLSRNDQSPLYMQLYRHIRALIQSGEIKDGMKLPSIRSLREQIHFSKTTIETAYQMLLAEGYVISKPRSGLYVVNPQSILSREEANSIDDLHTLKDYDVPYSTRDRLIDFSLLDVDGDSFPVQAWRSVLTESLSLNSRFIHQYGDPKGEYDLRSSIAQYLKSSRGVSCLPEQIVIGSGISYSIHLLSRLLEAPVTMAFEENALAQVGDTFLQNGFNIVPFQLREHELSMTELAQKNIRAIYVTPSHRPTGNPLAYPIRQQMLRWACDHGAYIIEDDYDGEFRYSGKTIPSLQGLDHNGVVIYIGTFSKAFTPSLRMNYMVLPPSLLKKLHSVEHILSSPSRIDQIAMKLFIERGHWYRHIRRMRKIYRLKHEKLTEFIHKDLSSHVQIRGDSAGLHMELTVKTSCSAEELIELALTEGVRVYRSQNTGMSRCNEHPKIYLGFGGINMKDMERGVQLLKKAWLGVLK